MDHQKDAATRVRREALEEKKRKLEQLRNVKQEKESEIAARRGAMVHKPKPDNNSNKSMH